MSADHEALREALEAIDDLLTNEIRVRWGMDNSMTEEEAAKGSRLYSLLLVPRNIARNALAKAALSTPTPPQPTPGERIIAGLEAALAGDVTRVTVLPPQPANGEVVEALATIRARAAALRKNIEAGRLDGPVRGLTARAKGELTAYENAGTIIAAALAKLEPSDGR